MTITKSAQPRVEVSAVPDAMVQLPGQATATTTFTLTNTGTATAAVTLTQSGNFFTLSASSFDLPAGASRTVDVRATAQQASSQPYEGTISVSGTGASGIAPIPVRLLVAAPPTAPVTARTVGRVDNFGVPGELLATATFTVTNSGTGVLQGILVSDVPWIIPPRNVITINPGQSVTVTYQIDRSKRPDANAITGGASGKLSLVFLSGTGANKGGLAITGSPGTTTGAGS